MTIGDKIKKIRTFRNMTQAELGAALGWGDKGANRLAQYETNYRVPRKDLVTEMAKILDVNPIALYEPTIMNAEELMETLFWIDEFNPGMIKLFQLETYPGEKCNSNEDTAVRYHDSDSWPANPPVGMWFNYGVLNEFMKEWVLRKEELRSGEITRDEYFEWKINWPQTCDGCGKYEPKKKWRIQQIQCSPKLENIPIMGSYSFFNLMLFYYMYSSFRQSLSTSSQTAYSRLFGYSLATTSLPI